MTNPSWLVSLGAVLFTWRTILPIPIILALLLVPAESSAQAFWAGAALVATGELIRLWAVRQIGVISRTRSDRLGPLVASGPFAFVRNPLYLGNIALWVGLAFSTGLVWLAPFVALVLAFAYHAIVSWEERLLESRLGEDYRRYQTQVPRWLPNFSRRPPGSSAAQLFSWRDTLFSERGTLVAIAVGYVLIWAKGLF